MEDTLRRTACESVGVYVGWTLLHWSLVHAYAYTCTPSGGWGILQAILVSQSTFCTTVRSASYLTGENMDHSCSAALAWGLLRLTSRRRPIA